MTSAILNLIKDDANKKLLIQMWYCKFDTPNVSIESINVNSF